MSWTRKLEVLRDIDSVIDFSRATAQLRILIALDEKSLTISELVEVTGLRRKTILDALRKLELKGLVKRDGDKLSLTESGRAIYNALKSIVSGVEDGEVYDRVHSMAVRPSLYDIYNDLISVIYMLRALKILGSSKNKTMPLDKLASKLRLSPVTLDSHLQRFSSRNLQIFSRIKESSRGERIVYKLSDLGIQLYAKLYQRRRGVDIVLNPLKNFLSSLVKSVFRR